MNFSCKFIKKSCLTCCMDFKAFDQHKSEDASVAIVDVKLLGVIFDSTLSMDKQVNAVVKACNFHIRALRHVRSCLTPEAARTISIGLVTSKLDYCNSLLYGTSESNLNKLQRVQND